MSKLDDLYGRALAAAKKPRAKRFIGQLVGDTALPGKGKRYYVVTGFHSKIAPQIADGVLRGVRGISSCKEIVPLWVNVREAIIVMDAAATRRLNNLVEVEYENPNALLADGMAVLHRLYDKTLDPHGSQQVMLRLVEAMKRGFKDVPGLEARLEAAEVRYFDGRSLADSCSDFSFAYMRYLEAGGRYLSTVDQIARWLSDNAPTVITGWNPRQGVKVMTLDDWRFLVTYAARSMGSQYEEECEVLVGGDALRIPKGSYLYVTPGGYEERRETLVDKWLPQLEQHYARVFIIEPSKTASARAQGRVHSRSFEKRKAKGLL